MTRGLEFRVFSEVPHTPRSEAEISPLQPVLLRKEMFPPGSIGYTFFPEDLEGKFRPAGALILPIEAIRQKDAKTPATMREQKIIDILSAPLIRTRNNSYNSAINIVKRHLQDLTTLPEAKLIGDILGQKQLPVPSEYEEEMRLVIREQLATLDPTQQTVLRLHYGFDDGIRKPYHVLESLIPDPKSIEAHAKERLQLPGLKRVLQNYSTVSEDSLAKEMFGAHIERDVPFLFGRINELALSEDAIAELRKTSLLDSRMYHAALLPVSLSQQTRDELVALLCEKANQPPHLPDNVLLPQIILTQEQLWALHQEPIDVLEVGIREKNAVKRSDRITIGELLATKAEDVAQFHNTGPIVAARLLAGLFTYFSVEDGPLKEEITTQFMEAFQKSINKRERPRKKRKPKLSPVIEETPPEISESSYEETIPIEHVIYEEPSSRIQRLIRRIKEHLDPPSR